MNPSFDNFHLYGINELEKAAFSAIRTTDRNILIHSGPGSGKTEILAQKAAYLIENGFVQNGKKILALSFKRNSARDLRNRVNQRLAPEKAKYFESCTFDSFAKILIDRFGELLPEIWQINPDYYIDENLLAPDVLRKEIHVAANGLYSLEEIESIPLYGFNRNYLTSVPLPHEINFSGTLSQDAGLLMWQYWLNKKPSTLIFPMLNALAELLLRTNPQLNSFLQKSYAHIFLDEFQDTTTDQYRLLKTAFAKSNIPLTAAGDENQNIMLWADAMPDGIEKFINDFYAKEINLQWNWRSAPQLVELQNNVAKKLLCDTLPEAIPVNSENNGICRALIFPDENKEKSFVINEISSLLGNGFLPQDICICVRHDSAACAKILADAAQNTALRFRDEVPIQNLLDENIVKLLFALWEVTFTDHAPEAWDEITKFLDRKNDIEKLIEFKKQISPLFSPMEFTRQNFESLIAASIDFLEMNRIHSTFDEYLHGQWFLQVISDLAAMAEENNFSGKSFYSALHSLKGDDVIPVLSIQRCKVKEFRAVFFIGLEDNIFREFQLDFLEEGCAFFIALSRAKEKLFFTACRFRNDNPQRFDEIRPLYKILADSGVAIEEINQ